MNLKIFTLKSFLVLTLIISPALTPRAEQEMSEEQMQQMMEQAQKMQECMAKIDQSAMDALALRSLTARRSVNPKR
jgi:membrane protein insertase Oxa1/YidC/SpoIIIJ